MRTLSMALIVFATAGTGTFANPVGGYLEDWEVSGDFAGWVPGTPDSTLVVVDAFGNPGGYLQTTGLPSLPFGASTLLPDVTGDFGGGTWDVSLDLLFATSNIDSAALRFTYLDATHNGWVYSLTNTFPTGVWTSYSVTFDTSWSDAQAIANGWVQEAGPTASWSQTMSDVFSTGIQLTSPGFSEAGLDNFTLTSVAPGPPPIPEPATLTLFGIGLSGLGFCGYWRRKRA